MKKISLILIIACLSFFSCSSGEHWKLRMAVPGKAKVDLKSYDRIVMVDFLIKGKKIDFDINKELRDYLSFELEKKANINVSSKKISASKTSDFEQPDFWKDLSPEMEKSLFLSGNIEYTVEVRKALTKKDKRRFEEPFPQESRLMQRRFYTLAIDLYLINAHTGEVVYKKAFKENKAYKNPNQTAFFAFFELIQGTRDKFFRDIKGDLRFQERYIIK